MLHMLPLDQLHLSAHNVRKTAADAGLDELTASLMHHGLQQNLVVIQEAPDRFAVIAGGRRLRALQAVRQAGDALPNCPDWRIPCRIVAAADATELSLAENTVRIAMHPADQFEAWSALVTDGKTVTEVATRFGVAEQLVRQRLRLGRVSPVLLAAYRAEKLTLDALKAFALTDDFARQEALWEGLKQYGPSLSPHVIRRELTQGAVSSTARLARFVGAEAYLAAGGQITRDLFGETDYFADAALLEALAEKKLAAEADALRPLWQWVEADLNPDHLRPARCRALPQTPVDAPEALASAYADARARLDQLEDGTGITEDDDAQALQAEYEQLEDELAALQDALEPFMTHTAADRARSGCLLTVGYDGRLHIQAGLVEDATPDESLRQASDPAPPPAVAEDSYSQSLRRDLATCRTQALQLAVGASFPAAFDLLTYSLCLQLLVPGRQRLPLDLSAVRFAGSLPDTDAAIEHAAALSALPLGWATDDPAASFAAFCALPERDKQALLAACVAACCTGGLAGTLHPALEAVGVRLGVQPRAHWQPDGALVFSRMRKAQLLALIGTLLDADWQTRLMEQPKGMIVGFLDQLFRGDATVTAGLSADMLARVRDWLPEGMAFTEPCTPSADVDTVTPLARPQPPAVTEPPLTSAISLPGWMTAA
jgi:ParB family chromosome partitioning protein